jgi:ribose 1,5-bisphosphate isomerase
MVKKVSKSKTIAKDIKSLKIQGASKVLASAITATLEDVLNSKAKKESEFRKEFLKNTNYLVESRPTEPAMRNVIRILRKSISKKGLTVEEMKKIIKKEVNDFEKNKKKNKKLMTKYGANYIPKNSTVLTICHSHSVIDVLIKAKNKIKKVYCLETRPLYQGRMTAKDLADAGLDVTLIVDNAASTVLKKCDFFFSGADAILADGDVINKIGTNQISTVCRRYDVKHMVVTSTDKFEPATFFGFNEPIELRAVEELGKKIRKVKVLNPAFDRTDANLIEGIITEKGIFTPKELSYKLYSDLDIKNHEEEFLKV